MLQSRIDFGTLAGDASRALSGRDAFVARSGLETSLLRLIRLRASQLNGCVCCLDMPTKDARALGEREQRLYMLSAWREAPFFTDRERTGWRGRRR